MRKVRITEKAFAMAMTGCGINGIADRAGESGLGQRKDASAIRMFSEKLKEKGKPWDTDARMDEDGSQPE